MYGKIATPPNRCSSRSIAQVELTSKVHRSSEVDRSPKVNRSSKVDRSSKVHRFSKVERNEQVAHRLVEAKGAQNLFEDRCRDFLVGRVGGAREVLYLDTSPH